MATTMPGAHRSGPGVSGADWSWLASRLVWAKHLGALAALATGGGRTDGHQPWLPGTPLNGPTTREVIQPP